MQGQLTVSLGEDEIKHAMVSMSAIPRKELREERKPGSRDKFLTASFVAEMEVSTDVIFRVKRGKESEELYRTALARHGEE
jgi:hypothetical protein